MYYVTFGPNLFSCLIGTLLMGVFFSEVVAFFNHPVDANNPRRKFDTYVLAALVVLSIAVTGLNWWSVYNITMTHAGDLAYPIYFATPELVQPPVTSCLTGVAQFWFAERAWRLLGKNIYFLILVSSLILLGIASAGAAVYYSFSAFMTTFVHAVTAQDINLWSFCLADILITATLIWKVRNLFHEAGANAPRQKRTFRNIIGLAFATGALTTITAALGASIYVWSWDINNSFMVPSLTVPRLSALSCVVTMNLRARWRSQAGGVINGHDLGIASAMTLNAPRADDEEMHVYRPSLAVRKGSSSSSLGKGSPRYGKGIDFGEELDYEPQLLRGNGKGSSDEVDLVECLRQNQSPSSKLPPLVETRELEFETQANST